MGILLDAPSIFLSILLPTLLRRLILWSKTSQNKYRTYCKVNTLSKFQIRLFLCWLDKRVKFIHIGQLIYNWGRRIMLINLCFTLLDFYRPKILERVRKIFFFSSLTLLVIVTTFPQIKKSVLSLEDEIEFIEEYLVEGEWSLDFMWNVKIIEFEIM